MPAHYNSREDGHGHSENAGHIDGLHKRGTGPGKGGWGVAPWRMLTHPQYDCNPFTVKDEARPDQDIKLQLYLYHQDANIRSKPLVDQSFSATESTVQQIGSLHNKFVFGSFLSAPRRNSRVSLAD